jgi:hypothetical protein
MFVTRSVTARAMLLEYAACALLRSTGPPAFAPLAGDDTVV